MRSESIKNIVEALENLPKLPLNPNDKIENKAYKTHYVFGQIEAYKHALRIIEELERIIK